MDLQNRFYSQTLKRSIGVTLCNNYLQKILQTLERQKTKLLNLKQKITNFLNLNIKKETELIFICLTLLYRPKATDAAWIKNLTQTL